MPLSYFDPRTDRIGSTVVVAGSQFVVPVQLAACVPLPDAFLWPEDLTGQTDKCEKIAKSRHNMEFTKEKKK